MQTQLLLIPYQLEDYAAAIEYARGLKEIDPARIALWGTSASGGYGMVIAAKDKNIACGVAQCPGLDSHASRETFLKRSGIGHFDIYTGDNFERSVSDQLDFF